MVGCGKLGCPEESFLINSSLSASKLIVFLGWAGEYLILLWFLISTSAPEPRTTDVDRGGPGSHVKDQIRLHTVGDCFLFSDPG